MATPEILLQLASGPIRHAVEQSTDEAPVFDSSGLKTSLLPAKATQILSISVTDPDVKDVLDAFDFSFDQNNADNRRRLRANVLQDLASSSNCVIKDFGLIAMQVRQIGDALKTIHQTFDDVTGRVDFASRDISSVNQESDAMLVERLRVVRKQAILDSFLHRFTVSTSDLNSITSSPQTLNDDFFETLNRIKCIYSDCQVLLGSENTRAGVEIMEQMTKHLNSAYQKVFLWLQKELKTLSFETPVGNHRVRKALDVLTGRPALFESCIGTLAESRQRTLFEAFNLALTGGNNASETKPIDMMAHDPTRYIGDMLAWLHSALVGELEALHAIFELPAIEDKFNGSLAGGLDNMLNDDVKLKNLAVPLADKSLEAVLLALRLRAEQIISSHEDPILLYSILNVLTFYRDIFRKLVGKEAVLVTNTDSLTSAATRQLQSCLRDLVRAVQHDTPHMTDDLSPPSFLLEALARFKDLMKNFETSLISDSDKPEAFEMVYSEALQPYIQGCQALSTKLSSPQSDIFIVNCLEVSKNTLRLSNFGAQNYLHVLDEIAKVHINSIVMHIHEQFLVASGLSEIVQIGDDHVKGSFDPQYLTPEVLQECSRRLDLFLPSAMMDAETRLRLLSRPSLRKIIIRSAMDQFVADFTRLETLLRQLPEDQFMVDWFPRTTEEIRILLS